MKLCIVFGTRPEIIKLSQIIRICEDKKMDYFLIHTNQHYSKDMDEIFFRELILPPPKYNLHIGSGTHGYQVGEMLKEIEKILILEKPDVVLVEGDTNAVLAGALSASKLKIKVAHVEAGLRSYDRNMPEEVNRIVVDHISDFLFCPTKLQEKILLKEGIEKEKIFVTGNTIVDAVLWVEKNQTEILKKMDIERNEYFLLTMHRAENVDSKERLWYLVNEITKLKDINIPIIFPMHPRTKKQLEQFGIFLPNIIKTCDPIGFNDMITLEKNAKCIFTDSGGIQEEACILKTHCVTLRTSTERPETIEVGGNKLMGNDLLKDYNEIIKHEKNWKNPFGDGNTSKLILDYLTKNER